MYIRYATNVFHAPIPLESSRKLHGEGLWEAMKGVCGPITALIFPPPWES